MNPFADGARAGVRLAYAGDPLDWLEANVRFPHSSRSTHFDRSTAPWWNAVIHDFADPTCRQTFVQACTGAGKSTALVSIIGLSDLVKAAQNAGKTTNEPLYFLMLAGLVYLVITTLSNRIFKRLERRYNLSIKGMAR